ncbi:MAG: flagellar basal-body rod protein FlgF [Rhodospirillales bacterium]|nr:flagellar basal-body rod protein FlgF [Rhodospirillales bacterium]
MTSAVYVSMSKQMVLRKQMEAIAQNLANITTPAFKNERVTFKEHLMPGPDGDMVSYVAEDKVQRDMTPGSYSNTGNDLDIAISGPGWFVIEADEGEFYTRRGHLRLDEDRTLVASSGEPILSDDDSEITLEEGDGVISISKDGTVSAESGILGRIKVVTFENESILQKAASGRFTSTEEPTELKAEETRLQQGVLESSNVNPILEMTRMIDVLRSYQSTQKLSKTDHDLQRRALREIAAVN